MVVDVTVEWWGTDVIVGPLYYVLVGWEVLVCGALVST